MLSSGEMLLSRRADEMCQMKVSASAESRTDTSSCSTAAYRREGGLHSEKSTCDVRSAVAGWRCELSLRETRARVQRGGTGAGLWCAMVCWAGLDRRSTVELRARLLRVGMRQAGGMVPAVDCMRARVSGGARLDC